MRLSSENPDTDSGRYALIIGAGPAGLTAAYELLTRTDIVPIVIEKDDCVGGLSRTVNYKGNRIDIGGHRFFSKSTRVMQWWLDILPMQAFEGEESTQLTYRGQKTTVLPLEQVDAVREDNVMLLRTRKSRVYFMRKFFDYPITLSLDTLCKLGALKTIRIGCSYLHAMLFPIRNEDNLEQFFINRFGSELYHTFFKSYTEKVWGVACRQISSEWGAQRVKSLSIFKAVIHFLKSVAKRGQQDVAQKDVGTSLIERFLYPKFGPGQMWEEVSARITAMGGQILMNWEVEEIEHSAEGKVTAVEARNSGTGLRRRFEAEYFFSSMPVKEMVPAFRPPAPTRIQEISAGLVYRAFITVGLLCKRIQLSEASGEVAADNWIYIQEGDVQVGRLQIFNNWSPAMVSDAENVWIGLEYFCDEGDALWSRSDGQMISLGTSELASLGFLEPADVIDATVIRMPKAYPAYVGSYDCFPEVVAWSNEFDNLFLVGRNGMHKYNNQDHSMLTAMLAVDNIAANVRCRDSLWALNTEQDYHEQTPSDQPRRRSLRLSPAGALTAAGK